MSGGLTALLGAVGLALGLSVIFGEPRHLQLGWVLPLVGVRFDLGPLGGLFTAATGAVAIAVGIYAVGYAKREHWARFPLVMLPLFVAAMLLVPAAGSVTTFLLAWELMAASSLVLVLSEHRRDAVRSAGAFYAVMTQLGFVAILLALVVLSAAGGGDAFAVIAAHADGLSSGTRNTVFLLTVLGFGSKAGLPSAACVVAEGPPRSTQPGLCPDECGDGQHGHLRHHPDRPAAARPRPSLVGPDADDLRRRVSGLRGASGLCGHRPQAAVGLLDH